jgi:hypothetical protein
MDERKQGYRVCFANPRAPTFFFPDPPYTYDWVKRFVCGIASAVRKDFEIPKQGHCEARQRGERMGQQLKIFARQWHIPEAHFRAICLEWHPSKGKIKRIPYDRLGMHDHG